MTAILKEIRDLDARLSRGELEHAEYLRKRAALLDSVEVAETGFAEPKRPAVAPRRNGSSSALALSLVVGLGVMTLCIALTLVLLPDLNMALTLGVTILAALSVTLLRDSEE